MGLELRNNNIDRISQISRPLTYLVEHGSLLLRHTTLGNGDAYCAAGNGSFFDLIASPLSTVKALDLIDPLIQPVSQGIGDLISCGVEINRFYAGRNAIGNLIDRWKIRMKVASKPVFEIAAPCRPT